MTVRFIPSGTNMILGEKAKNPKQLGKCQWEYRWFVLAVADWSAVWYNVTENYKIYAYWYKDLKQKIDNYYKTR